MVRGEGATIHDQRSTINAIKLLIYNAMNDTSINDARADAREEEVQRALLARLLATVLGDDTNIAAYHRIVDQYPATALLCAYETARNLPSALVRKSRGAYFTFLLQRLCPIQPSSPSRQEPA